MWNKFINTRLGSKWVSAFSIILSPVFLLSTVVTGFALFLSVTHRDNVAFSNTMAILGSIFGGIAGAFFKDAYDDLEGKKILEKKGRSALRNLEGINTQLGNIKIWILEFIKKTRKKEDRHVLEEINRHIATIELNIASGLEDWVDIVPELKERNQKEAAIDKKYKDLFDTYLNELVQTRRELASSTDAQKEDLKKKISELEKLIKDVKKERYQAIGGVGLGSAGGTSVFYPSSGSSDFYATYVGLRMCTKCGKYFTPMADVSAGRSVFEGLCPECVKNSK